MSIPDTKTDNFRIKEVALEEKGLKCSLEVPWSKYPMPVTVPANHPIGAKLKPGTVWAWTLKRGNLRKGQDGSTADGSKEYHYWWNFGAVEAPEAAEAAPQPPQAAAPATAQAQAIPAATDLRDQSIERQVSAKNRTELAIACLKLAGEQTSADGIWDTILNNAWAAYHRFAPITETQPSPDPDNELPF